jgi:hypothetical protein
MSYFSQLYDRLVDIACNGYGYSTFTIPAGLFHLKSEDAREVEEQWNSSIERVISINISLPKETVEYPVNECDGFGIFVHELRVDVGYQLTNEADGTVNGITNKALSDFQKLRNALEWYENITSGTDPNIISIILDGQPSMTENQDNMVMSINFILTVKATIPSNY